MSNFQPQTLARQNSLIVRQCLRNNALRKEFLQVSKIGHLQSFSFIDDRDLDLCPPAFNSPSWIFKTFVNTGTQKIHYICCPIQAQGDVPGRWGGRSKLEVGGCSKTSNTSQLIGANSIAFGVRMVAVLCKHHPCAPLHRAVWMWTRIIYLDLSCRRPLEL